MVLGSSAAKVEATDISQEKKRSKISVKDKSPGITSAEAVQISTSSVTRPVEKTPRVKMMAKKAQKTGN